MPSRQALPDHDEQFIQRQLESGRYHDRNEVIHAGLEMLQEFEHGLERWIQDELPGRYAELKSDPSKAIPLAEARARFEQRYQDDLAKAK
ncbi:type II toxin-antitoxin system ParD family antitoxin [Rhizobium leguminosarum]|uniref:ribbon-helix-helix domain-containing protein n=1 Tax=Rhizobium leguminosarum TaxID=384 RepID=UPI001030E9C5|nr:type II toxin-antitoxin system ParD family antitoxin [Rhizobium leguminosarum]TBG08419.1 type II toxin-antitoxin system ParD family antitoxin [Rhizobium leguminosarum]